MSRIGPHPIVKIQVLLLTRYRRKILFRENHTILVLASGLCPRIFTIEVFRYGWGLVPQTSQLGIPDSVVLRQLGIREIFQLAFSGFDRDFAVLD
jgi:hypothetical protein